MVYFPYSGPQDASELIQAYLDPAIEGLSYGFNGGWYSSAKTHKTLGFDLGVVCMPFSFHHLTTASIQESSTSG